MKKITKIAILDRDGVINQNKINNGYIGHKQDFKWIKGILEMYDGHNVKVLGGPKIKSQLCKTN